MELRRSLDGERRAPGPFPTGGLGEPVIGRPTDPERGSEDSCASMPRTTWSRFLATPRTLGPTAGARESWHRGRTRYAVWVLRVDDPEVRARRDLAAARLAAFGLRTGTDPHVTVFVAGFPCVVPRDDDDVAEATLAAQRAALLGARPRRPRLTVGGLNAFPSCPFLEIHAPPEDLAALARPLRARAREQRCSAWVPHLTVGTFDRAHPTGPVAAAIAPMRELPPLHVHPDAIELIEIDSADPDSPLHTRWRVPLS